MVKLIVNSNLDWISSSFPTETEISKSIDLAEEWLNLNILSNSSNGFFLRRRLSEKEYSTKFNKYLFNSIKYWQKELKSRHDKMRDLTGEESFPTDNEINNTNISQHNNQNNDYYSNDYSNEWYN